MPSAALFVVLGLVACRPAPWSEEESVLPESAKAFEVTFRVHDGDVVLRKSRFPVLSLQRAVWQVECQMTSPDDFDIEIASTPLIGDPVMDIVVEGIRVDPAAATAPGARRIALDWRTEVDKPGKMIQGREARIVIVLLPDVEGRAAAGSALLEPGVATRLTRILSKGRELDVSVAVRIVNAF